METETWKWGLSQRPVFVNRLVFLSLFLIRQEWRNHQHSGVWRGGKGATIPRVPKSPNNVTSTFFNIVQHICFRKTSGWNMGGAQLVSCSRARSNLVVPPANNIEFAALTDASLAMFRCLLVRHWPSEWLQLVQSRAFQLKGCHFSQGRPSPSSEPPPGQKVFSRGV